MTESVIFGREVQSFVWSTWHAHCRARFVVVFATKNSFMLEHDPGWFKREATLGSKKQLRSVPSSEHAKSCTHSLTCSQGEKQIEHSNSSSKTMFE